MRIGGILGDVFPSLNKPLCAIQGHEWGKWGGNFGYVSLASYCKHCQKVRYRENPLVTDHKAREKVLWRVAQEIYEISPQMRYRLDEHGEKIEHPDYQEYLGKVCSYWMDQWDMEIDPDAPTFAKMDESRRQEYRSMAHEITNGGLDMVVWGPEKAMLHN